MGIPPPSLGFQCEPEMCEHEGSLSRVGAIFWCCGGRTWKGMEGTACNFNVMWPAALEVMKLSNGGLRFLEPVVHAEWERMKCMLRK